ncbi:MAG: type I methionyl aminopeptidase [Oscillospiraceae bacterium]|jgi:methionyl aminopeptidase|nr:type I methionyl aminopeptidase [Oscillospiraceae bacterium]
MIVIKSEREIEAMRKAGAIAGAALKVAGAMIQPGVSTRQIDNALRQYLRKQGAKPSFLGYRGYPASCNTSVNEEVIHGIPGRRTLREGDIVSIDVGAYFEGFHGDTAATFPVGSVSEEALRLIEVTRKCFYEGLAHALAGKRISDISAAVEKYAERNGCAVVRDWTGHGVGRELHEDPEVPNFRDSKRGSARLLPGMTIAIEPMITAGGGETETLRDGWTIVTKDRSLSAHHEHTVLITAGEPELLTVAAD